MDRNLPAPIEAPTRGRAFSRRTLLQTAMLAFPIGGTFLMSQVSSANADGTPVINIIDAVTRSVNDFVLGITKPDATTAGVLSDAVLSVVDGDLICAAGQTYSNLDIRGFVTGAAGATLVNCYVRGRSGRTVLGLVDNSAAGFTISRCTLNPSFPKYYQNGVTGSNILVDRCDIFNVVDGVHISNGDNVKVHGTYIHDLSFFDGSTGTEHKTDYRFPGWTHNDGIQSLGGANLEVIGCNIQSYFSATTGTPATAINGVNGISYPKRNYSNGITLTPKGSGITNYLIKSNWFEGGEVAVQIPSQSSGHDSGNNGTISDNRFGLDQHPYGNSYQQIRYTTGIGDVNGMGDTPLESNIYDYVPSVPVELQGKPLSNPSGTNNQTTYAVKQ